MRSQHSSITSMEIVILTNKEKNISHSEKSQIQNGAAMSQSSRTKYEFTKASIKAKG